MRVFFLSAIIVFFFPLVAFASSDPAGIALWRWDKIKIPTVTRHFSATENGNSLAVGDLGNDDIAEIVVGAPYGAWPEVRLLRGDGSQIASFLAYEKEMTQGVTVAIGTLHGHTEIVTGTGTGAVAQVRVFDVHGKEKRIAGGFFPYGKDFKGGVNVAVGDIDGDGHTEIITAPGPTGGPHVQIWSNDGKKKGDFFAFENASTVGLHVVVGDLNGDGKAEIVAALGGPSSPIVRVFDGVTYEKLREFTAIGRGFEGGLNLAIGDVDDDRKNDILVAPNGNGGPHVHAYHTDGTLIGAFFSQNQTYRGGVILGVGRFGANGTQVVTMPAEHNVRSRPQDAKSIYVSVKEQRLYAYEYGRLVKTFLVATGMKGSPTPLGDFQVLAKPYKVNYRWSYGPNNRNNYDFGWVTWNLRIAPHIYIHYAPWRKIFGIRGSHGCVNISKGDAQWIYDWGEVGTPVTIANE